MPSKNRFTERAQKVLALAQEAAEQFNHNYIGTEHLLIGLLKEGSGVANQVLAKLGVQLGRVNSIVEKISGPGRRTPFSKIELTPRTRRVIELAVEEAKQLNQSYISTEHLLLGLAKQGDGVAIDILHQLGVSPEQIRSETQKYISEAVASGAGQLQPATQTGAAPKKERSKTPLVDQLATDLTAQAQDNKLDPVIGRQTEIERVIQILSRRTKNNPALIGEPGVGKTAIVEGLAQRIIAGDTPEPLLNKRLLQLDVGSLVAGTMYRGQFEERLKRVIEELKNSDSILFIDEVHMLVGAGSAGSAVDAANILKPALSRGELQCIGATTLEEYRKHIESDAALERRFQPVMVDEPTVDETIEILRGIRSRYEDHHKLTITDAALESAAHLAARYVPERFLPDKAIDLIDETSARVRMYKSPKHISLRQTLEELRNAQRDLEEAVRGDRLADAEALRAREAELQTTLEETRATLDDENLRVTSEDIAELVSMWTGIPVVRIAGAESERLLQMEKALHARIVGQDEAITAISKAVRRSRSGLKDPKRPIGSFVFLGPTGVGKTELAKALAEFLFGSEDALIQLDMSEFMERHTTARLVGAPPGYVGYEDAGQLTETLRRRPYSIVVFDEIEKAHPDVFNMLLQIMEEGHLADARGHRVDFRNAMIVMTSNIGAEMIRRNTTLGFAIKRDEAKTAEESYQQMRDKLLAELKHVFRPEFLNRLDSVVVFRSLSKEEITQIVELEMKKVESRLVDYNIKLEIAQAAKNFIADEGFDPEFGARPLRRVIQNRVEDALSEGVLSGKFQNGDTIIIDLLEGNLDFQTRRPEPELEPEPPLAMPA